MEDSVAQTPAQARRPLRRRLITGIAIAVAALAIVVTSRLGTLFPGNGAAAATGSPVPSLVAVASDEPAMSVAPTATALPPTAPPPTPEPLVPAPLTGLPVSPEAAIRHPIAVMVDDQADARPQAGFNKASVVWQAPAEGGVPRYMLIFQDQVPDAVGPIRSARQYYVEWASELDAMYVHHGGSPGALNTLANHGNGSWVYNADGFRWEGRFVFRVHTDGRFPPHNVMSDGSHLRKLAKRLGADDGPVKASWTFGPEAPAEERPAAGGSIKLVYPYETITYRYDPEGNRYLRYLNGSKVAQVDFADGQLVAPRNVVILRMFFGAITDDRHGRLEAHNVGKGEAWISTNGVTVKGTWKKASKTAPTLLFGPDGEPITLTAGQTFVQVIAMTYTFKIKDGALPGASPSATP